MIGVREAGQGEDAAFRYEFPDRREAMQEPATPSIRTGRGHGPSREVARVKALYLRALKARVRDGSYFTPERVDRALARLLDAVRQDLPLDPLE